MWSEQLVEDENFPRIYQIPLMFLGVYAKTDMVIYER